MSRKLRIAYFAHTLRSDWNNGNAHFLRGLMRALCSMGHDVTIWEPEHEWSINNLREEPNGASSLQQFSHVYPELKISTYAATDPSGLWSERLRDREVVILHEWNPPGLASLLLDLRDQCGFRLMFHDTHHRASSSPQEIERFQLTRFDGVLAFARVLENIYRERYGINRVWTLHEAADTTVFRPHPQIARRDELVWIGNWGDDERSAEIAEFLLDPASALKSRLHTTVYGVRYPEEGLQALAAAHVHYGGYLPNLQAPAVYAGARATVHIPRQQYARVMHGVPTIRVFEALACGIPLVSAPWRDSEDLFRPEDFIWANDATEMQRALCYLLTEPSAAEDQASRGLESILAKHTCMHRAEELTAICEEILL